MSDGIEGAEGTSKPDGERVIRDDAEEIYRVENRSLSAREAADRFAAEYYPKPRTVAIFTGARAFQLVGGYRWYMVEKARYGWRVMREK